MGAPPRPTRVRYVIVAVCAAVAVVLYLDRVCLSIVSPYVREELGISSGQFDTVMSAFFVTYALGQVPAGWLADRFGARRMMTFYLLTCGLCIAGIASATTLVGLIALRLALGLAEAGGYPTAGGLLRRWVPAEGRGRANSLVAVGGRAGGAATQYLTAILVVLFVPLSLSSLFTPAEMLDPGKLRAAIANAEPDSLAARMSQRLPAGDDPAELAAALNAAIADPSLTNGVTLDKSRLPGQARAILAKHVQDRTPAETERLNRLVLEVELPGAFRQVFGAGWRPAFLVYACVGVGVGILFWFLARDRPDLHPWCNAAEVELTRPPAAPEAPLAPPTTTPLLVLLARDRNLWLSSACQVGLNFGWAFLITKLPDFLAERYGVPLGERGMMAMVPLLLGVVGMLLGGWLADLLARRLSGRRSRSLVLGLAPMVGAAAFAWLPWAPNAWAATAAFALVALATDLTVPSVWSLAQDLTKRRVGAVMGWANMWGNLGAAASPLLLGQLRKWEMLPAWMSGWTAVFAACALAFVLAGVAGLFIDARRPLDPAER